MIQASTITTEHIWDQYAQDLKRYIRSRVDQASMAEDIIQNIFVKVHLNIHQVADTSKIKYWLFAIARHEIANYIRAETRIRDLTPVPHAAPSPYEEIGLWLPLYLLLLPQDERYLIEEIELKGRKQTDLAQELGMPYSTLKSQVQRIKKKLRDYIEACCQFTFDSQGRVIDYKKKGNCKIC